ncbi:MAG: acyl-CoA dehydrogenase family protein, partial [Actinomycetota bacterium]
MEEVLERFGPATREWFRAAFPAPTRAQVGAWTHAVEGHSVLVSAPTGSGKTLAAFLSAIDRLTTEPPADHTRVLYISPLKALAYDVDRNLRAPLVGIQQAAARLGIELNPVTVGLRSGDTAEIALTDVRVDGDAVLGEVGGGMKVALSALDNGRFSLSAGCVGTCREALEVGLKYATERTQFGKPIASFQLVQELLAQIHVDYQAAKALVDRV